LLRIYLAGEKYKDNRTKIEAGNVSG